VGGGFKFDVRLVMPSRQTPEAYEECTHCQQQHSPKERCEGLGFDHQQPVAYEVPQVENSSYLKKALAQFKNKRKKKNANKS